MASKQDVSRTGSSVSVRKNVSFENSSSMGSRTSLQREKNAGPKKSIFSRIIGGTWNTLKKVYLKATKCKSFKIIYSKNVFFKVLWATRQTQDTSQNNDLLIKTTLKELVTYSIYLVVITISKLFAHYQVMMMKSPIFTYFIEMLIFESGVLFVITAKLLFQNYCSI